MGELIRTYMFGYAFVAVYAGITILAIIVGIFKKTRDMEHSGIKAILRFGISGVLVCFWAWFFVYTEFFPFYQAHYEYTHNLSEEDVGEIESITILNKDHILIVIDDTQYTMAYSSASPIIDIGRDIKEGDTVKVVFGTKSKFVFEIDASESFLDDEK